MLVPVGGDGYAFRHALLAEAVYDDLLPGERVRLHAAYVDALRRASVAGTAAELARHARAAHDLATAARASIAAGDEAMAVAGPDEAARHYEVALELATDSPDVTKSIGEGPEGPLDLVELTARACEAAIASGQTYRAIALARDQLRSLPADTPPGPAAPALSWPRRNPRRHGGRRAVVHHRGDGDPGRAPRRADASPGSSPCTPGRLGVQGEDLRADLFVRVLREQLERLVVFSARRPRCRRRWRRGLDPQQPEPGVR